MVGVATLAVSVKVRLTTDGALTTVVKVVVVPSVRTVMVVEVRESVEVAVVASVTVAQSLWVEVETYV